MAWPQLVGAGDRTQPLPTPVPPGQRPLKSIFQRTLEEGELGRAKDWLFTVEAAKALTAPRVQWDIAAWAAPGKGQLPLCARGAGGAGGERVRHRPKSQCGHWTAGGSAKSPLRTGVQDAVARGDRERTRGVAAA